MSTDNINNIPIEEEMSEQILIDIDSEDSFSSDSEMSDIEITKNLYNSKYAQPKVKKSTSHHKTAQSYHKTAQSYHKRHQKVHNTQTLHTGQVPAPDQWQSMFEMMNAINKRLNHIESGLSIANRS